MEISRNLVAPCGPERLFAWIEDLALYPQWMQLVHDVEPLGVDAWQVELQARVGPFARSKSLRMIRAVHDPPHRVVYQRAEIDGKEHSMWEMRATVEPREPEATGLTIELHYGGNLWAGPVLQRVLDDAVRRGSDALIDVVSDAPTP